MTHINTRRNTKQRILLGTLFLVLVAIAVAGWLVEAVRVTLAGGGGRALPAT